VSHCGLTIYVKKYLEEKRRIMETQIFHHAKIQSSENPVKETKILQDIITNLKFQYKPQNIIFHKFSYKTGPIT
jgi:hypothetical protein